MNIAHKNKFFKFVCILLSICLLFTGVFALYVSDYYRATDSAVAALQSTEQITVSKDGENYVFMPDAPKAGLIFYPGGKVEVTAYAPLMQAFAREGICSILLTMPFNLAFLNVNAADGYAQKYPEISSWYIGGHSLGGSIAGSYLSTHLNDFDGLILLASYSTSSVIREGLKVVSIIGTQDFAMHRAFYHFFHDRLPDDCLEVDLDGGCHSYFGDYGLQRGDGTPAITVQEQMTSTVNICKEYFCW